MRTQRQRAKHLAIQRLAKASAACRADARRASPPPLRGEWSALYCGGRLTPATVEGVRYLARTLGEPGFGGDDPTLRHAVLSFLREVAAVALTGVDREAASRRDEPDVRQWLAASLREPRSVLDWTLAETPGEILLAAARADCFDLLPEVFATRGSTTHTPACACSAI